MAAFNNPRSNYEQDSLVICDGLAPLVDPLYAGGGVGEGRFAFILGDVEYDYSDDNLENEFATFNIDIVNMFLSKRTRISVNGDFYSFGIQCGFYALNENTLVVVSYNEEEQILRQWLVRINYETETVRSAHSAYLQSMKHTCPTIFVAHCDLYRSYEMVFNGIQPQTTVGEKFAIITTDAEAYIIPTNPLSSKQQTDIRPLINQAAVNLGLLYRPGTVNTNDFMIGDIPFFITSTVLGFFIELSGNGEGNTYDLMTVAVLDVTNGSAYLQEVSSSSDSRLSIEGLRTQGVSWDQVNEREVTVFGSLNGHVIFFGVLNTRLLEFTEIKACAEPDDTLTLLAFTDCIIIADKVEGGDEGDRFVHNGEDEGETMDRFRLIRHPLRVPSLTQLASIVVQNSGIVEMQQLQQISDRLC